jgi:hypothetical protein
MVIVPSAHAAPIENPGAERSAVGYLARARAQEFAGTRLPNGSCSSGFQITVQPGDPPSGAVEVARDEAVCTQTFEIGPLTAEAAKANQPSAGDQLRRRGEARVRLRAHAAAYSYKNAYFKTTVRGNYLGGARDIAWVYNRVAWYYGNGCVHNPIDAGTSSDWYSADGWGRTAVDFASGASCDFAYSSSYATIVDQGRRCGGQPYAYVEFNRNSIHGNPNGSFSIYDGSGFCIDDLGPFRVFAWSYI